MSFARFTPSEDRALKECFKKKFSLSRDSETLVFRSFLLFYILKLLSIPWVRDKVTESNGC